MRLFASRAALLLAVVALLYAPERASAAAFDCRGLYLSVATVPTLQTTTSTTPVDLPGASVTVEMDACVRVQFSAQVKAKAPGAMRVRLLQNGVPVGAPTRVDLQTSGEGYDNRTVTFVIRNAGSGIQTLQIQYSSIDGRPVRVNKGIVSVWYTEPVH